MVKDENDMEEENLASPVVNKIYREDFLWKRGEWGGHFGVLKRIKYETHLGIQLTHFEGLSTIYRKYSYLFEDLRFINI